MTNHNSDDNDRPLMLDLDLRLGPSMLQRGCADQHREKQDEAAQQVRQNEHESKLRTDMAPSFAAAADGATIGYQAARPGNVVQRSTAWFETEHKAEAVEACRPRSCADVRPARVDRAPMCTQSHADVDTSRRGVLPMWTTAELSASGGSIRKCGAIQWAAFVHGHRATDLHSGGNSTVLGAHDGADPTGSGRYGSHGTRSSGGRHGEGDDKPLARTGSSDRSRAVKQR